MVVMLSGVEEGGTELGMPLWAMQEPRMCDDESTHYIKIIKIFLHVFKVLCFVQFSPVLLAGGAKM